MNKPVNLIAGILLLFLNACRHSDKSVEQLTTSDGIKYVKLSPVDGTDNTMFGGRYKGYEITDPGIQNMSAIILQIPDGWQAQHSFTRIWNGSTPINQVYVKAGDATTTVEILPYAPYYYVDGPTTRSLRATSSSMGYAPQYQPFELPPMDPLTYLKQVVLPKLQQNGFQFNITNEQNLGQQNQFKGIPASQHAYVEGKLNDGRTVRVECGITVTANNVSGETYYNWSAFPAIITAAADVDAGYEVLKHMRSTVMYNPEWEQQCAVLNRKGNAANAEIAQRDFENVKNYREAVNNIHKGVQDYRDQSQDRNNESFRDVIGGEGKFENPYNGERVRLDDKYKYYYSDNKGNYYASDEPMDYKAMGWTEMNRLSTKEY